MNLIFVCLLDGRCKEGSSVVRSATGTDERARYLDVFNALADPIRLEIVSRCAATEECACTLLEEVLPVAKSTISYHIKILYRAGLLEVRKDGRFYHYRLKRDVMEAFLPGFLGRLTP